MKKEDNVNHPKHYADTCSLECIEVMEVAFGTVAVVDFCLCNSFKYLWRYKNKNGREDLEKAQWYLAHADKLFSTRHTESTDEEQVQKLCRMRQLLIDISDQAANEQWEDFKNV